MKVAPLFPPALREDPVAFLHALANDWHAGAYSMPMKGAIIVMDGDGGLRLWSFGAGVKSRLETLGLLQAGAQLQYEVVVGDTACE